MNRKFIVVDDDGSILTKKATYYLKDNGLLECRDNNGHYAESKDTVCYEVGETDKHGDEIHEGDKLWGDSGAEYIACMRGATDSDGCLCCWTCATLAEENLSLRAPKPKLTLRGLGWGETYRFKDTSYHVNSYQEYMEHIAYYDGDLDREVERVKVTVEVIDEQA